MLLCPGVSSQELRTLSQKSLDRCLSLAYWSELGHAPFPPVTAKENGISTTGFVRMAGNGASLPQSSWSRGEK